jgi:hypothetical protein
MPRIMRSAQEPRLELLAVVSLALQDAIRRKQSCRSKSFWFAPAILLSHAGTSPRGGRTAEDPVRSVGWIALGFADRDPAMVVDQHAVGERPPISMRISDIRPPPREN